MDGHALRTGDAVRIRGERWRVAAVSSFDSVSMVDVDGCDTTNHGFRARFLLPFERIDRIGSRANAPRVMTLPRWRRTVRALLAGAAPHWSSLRAAARAHLTIFPFQLEPAIAVTRGDTCRLLIADEVGLGKTIQAGLIVGETIARTPDARILIVSPAGLREQWRDELQRRFDIAAGVLDAEGVARTASQLLPDVNPWSIHPVAITSIDYVKRPEVMRPLETLTWDVVVFDEAHALAGRSDRATAAAALARRARVAVLLTATPHSGDDEAFARLRALGDIDNAFPLTTFRRRRCDVGLPHGRRLVQLRIQLTPEEERMHEALNRYVRRITDEGSGGASALVASILLRRACSSASSLARSLERRLTLLSGNTLSARDQLMLPFLDADGDEEPAAELGLAALRDTEDEMRSSRDLIDLARAAASSESKIAAVRRLIRRAAEPLLVFTEYRDTLHHLASLLDAFSPLQLHGGLGARERIDVLRQFTSGNASLLLATDAASEGLNLHQRCRLVVNLELPWTPLRLEQRIGRVDRLGQRRRVHAVQLVAKGTHEETMVERLDQRTGRIHAAFDAGSECDVALRSAARDEATRLVASRALASDAASATRANGSVVTTVRATGLMRGTLWAFRLSFTDAGERFVFETIAGVLDQRDGATLDSTIERVLGSYHQQFLRITADGLAAWLALATAREKAIASALRGNHARLSAALLQPGLFDRRAERAAAAQTLRVAEATQKSHGRLAALERCRHLRVDDPVFVFGITYR